MLRLPATWSQSCCCFCVASLNFTGPAFCSYSILFFLFSLFEWLGSDGGSRGKGWCCSICNAQFVVHRILTHSEAIICPSQVNFLRQLNQKEKGRFSSCGDRLYSTKQNKTIFHTILSDAKKNLNVFCFVSLIIFIWIFLLSKFLIGPTTGKHRESRCPR